MTSRFHANVASYCFGQGPDALTEDPADSLEDLDSGLGPVGQQSIQSRALQDESRRLLQSPRVAGPIALIEHGQQTEHTPVADGQK